MPFKKKKIMARFIYLFIIYNKKGNIIKLETTYNGVHKVKRKKNTHTLKLQLWAVEKPIISNIP